MSQNIHEIKINKTDLPLFIFLESSDEVDAMGSGSSISMSSVPKAWSGENIQQKSAAKKRFNRKNQSKEDNKKEKSVEIGVQIRTYIKLLFFLIICNSWRWVWEWGLQKYAL
jgi:hypothetical protein